MAIRSGFCARPSEMQWGSEVARLLSSVDSLDMSSISGVDWDSVRGP